MTEELELVRGSENPFRDVGLPDADTKLIRLTWLPRLSAFCGNAGLEGGGRGEDCRRSDGGYFAHP